MKSSFLFIFAAGILAYFTLSSRSGGVGTQNNTEAAGNPGGGTCMNCHLGGTFNPTTTIDIKNSAGSNVTSVESDSVYDVTVTIVAGNGTPSAYGFQAIFLSDSLNINAGNFQNLGNGQATKTFANGRVCVEHNTPSTANSFSFQWKAPASVPGGTATLYAYGLAVNMNGGSTGDIGNGATYQVTVTQSSTPTSTSNVEETAIEFNLFPNPVVSQLNLSLELLSDGNYELAIFNSYGQLSRNQTFFAHKGKNYQSIGVSDLIPGTYLLTLSNERGEQYSKSFVKF